MEHVRCGDQALDAVTHGAALTLGSIAGIGFDADARVPLAKEGSPLLDERTRGGDAQQCSVFLSEPTDSRWQGEGQRFAGGGGSGDGNVFAGEGELERLSLMTVKGRDGRWEQCVNAGFNGRKCGGARLDSVR